MKNLFIFITAFALLLLTSCSDDKNNPEVVIPDGSYAGTFITIQKDNTVFSWQDSKVFLEFSEDNSTVDIKMNAVKFAAEMPALNIVIPEVPLKPTSKGYSLSADVIIPTYLGKPFPMYTILGLAGQITTTTLEFSMDCGGYDVTYSGKQSDSN